MRKLMWFSLGFLLAAALCALFLPGLWCLAGLGALILGALGLVLLRKRDKTSPLPLLFLGLGLGVLWCWIYTGILLEPAMAADGTVTELQAEVCDFPKETKYGGSVEGYVTLEGRRYRTLIYLRSAMPELEPGDRLVFPGELRVTAEGGSREPTYHRTQGVFLLAYAKAEAMVEKGEKIPLRYRPALWRRAIGDRISALFPEDTAGFAKALLQGDKTDLDYGMRNDLSLAGLSHIVAVSGLHVSILFGALYLLLSRRPGPGILVGIPLAVAFAALAGFTPSVTRAAIMQILMLLAAGLKREYDPPTALSFAGLVILIFNPMAVSAVSFQLSFGAVAGIFLFSGRISRFLLAEKRLNAAKGRSLRNRTLRLLAGSVSVTLGASVFTTPLVACYFGVVSLASPLTNLLCLWAVSLAFQLSALACLAGFLWLPLGRVFAWLSAWLVRWVLGAAGTAARFPLCALYTESPYTVLWLAFSYVLFALLLIFKKRPGVFLWTAAVGLCLSLILSWAEPLTDSLRVTALDVGQGQCVLLQSGRRTFVVDCGGSNGESAGESAARQLLSMGIDRIDGLILTHLDEDHAGGAEQLLRRIRADVVAVPAAESLERRQTAGLLDVELLDVDEDRVLDFTGGSLRIIASGDDAAENNDGIAVLFTVGDCDTLITGDWDGNRERWLLENRSLPDLEILVVGHHGSKYACCRELLEMLTPDVAIISVGKNSYGHPAAETLERLTAAGCRILRTDQAGTILVRR